MRCLINKDQPLRVQISKGGVIHAAAHTKDPKKLSIACRWESLEEPFKGYLVSNTTSITCKACMKRIGMYENPESPKRYIVRKIDSGEFLKNTNSRCSIWSNSVSDAFFFRKKHTARNKCEVVFHRVGDKLMTFVEWVEAGRPINELETIHDPNLEIKAVKFTLED